jgi:predicted nucleic acid-binding protein
MLNNKMRRKKAIDLFKSISDPEYNVIVSQVVVGETITKLLSRKRKLYHRLFSRFIYIFRWLGINTRNSMEPISKDILIITQELLERDHRLDVTDAVIVAAALANPNSRVLYTVDGKLVDNPKIIEYEKELRTAGKRKEELVIIGRFLA